MTTGLQGGVPPELDGRERLAPSSRRDLEAADLVSSGRRLDVGHRDAVSHVAVPEVTDDGGAGARIAAGARSRRRVGVMSAGGGGITAPAADDPAAAAMAEAGTAVVSGWKLVAAHGRGAFVELEGRVIRTGVAMWGNRLGRQPQQLSRAGGGQEAERPSRRQVARVRSVSGVDKKWLPSPSSAAPFSREGRPVLGPGGLYVSCLSLLASAAQQEACTRAGLMTVHSAECDWGELGVMDGRMAQKLGK